MVNLDWIPVICRRIGRNGVGRRYMYNRLSELRQALAEWWKQQSDCAERLAAQELSRSERSNYAVFNGLLHRELTYLKIAVSQIEVWCSGGGDVSLARAQKAYAQAQAIWKKRLNMMQKLSLYPRHYV